MATCFASFFVFVLIWHSFPAVHSLELPVEERIETTTTDDNYVIVVDAGSSGSRVHIFKYSDDLPVPRFSEVKSKKWGPGEFAASLQHSASLSNASFFTNGIHTNTRTRTGIHALTFLLSYLRTQP